LLRNGKIPHAYQEGSRWIIPHSGKKGNIIPLKSEKKPNSNKTKVTVSRFHKLEPIANWLCIYLEQNYRNKPDYFLEHKPDWLLSYPSKKLVTNYPVIKDLYAELVNKELQLEKQINSLAKNKLNRKQAYDIWIGPPFNFAVEFDEKQHFNQYRAISLEYYEGIMTNFPISLYQELNANTQIKPGKSGFTKLKSKDPFFPELLPGEAQDNRIRQRAFRDYLKDLLPLANNQNPTLRIPYQITNGKIKNFGTPELQKLRKHLDSITLQY